MITSYGPNVYTHARHFAQKAWYTVATRWSAEEGGHVFCPHGTIFTDEGGDQKRPP